LAFVILPTPNEPPRSRRFAPFFDGWHCH
jgi:hypothetical protein